MRGTDKMTNLIILPILIPLLTGTILIFLRKKIMAQRVIAVYLRYL